MSWLISVQMDQFEVKKSVELGRYAVASKDFKGGEVIFEEMPFCVGPKPSSRCCCLECFSFVDPSPLGSRCPECFWPLCGKCVNSNLKYHKNECELFKKAKSKFQNVCDPNAICLQLDCITPLRTLFARHADKRRWEDEVDPMEDHMTERKNSPHWKVDQINIVQYLLSACKLKDTLPDVDVNLIHKVIGILEVNAFEAKTSEGDYIRCLFPKLAILAHSCNPNTAHSIYPSKDFKLQARTTVLVKSESLIYSCYTYTMNGTTKRQEHLKLGKYFDCRCERCLSASELGTNFSSIKCEKCSSGLIAFKNPPLNDVWICNNPACLFELSGIEVDSKMAFLEDEIDEILYQQTGSNKFEMIESLLVKLDKDLSKSHYLQIFVKNILVDLYSKLEKKLSEKQLKRKIELSWEILKVLDVLEAGKTRSRAMVLFELAKPLETLSKSEENLIEVERLLSECWEILSFEDDTSAEGKLGKIAQEKLSEIRNKLSNKSRQ